MAKTHPQHAYQWSHSRSPNVQELFYSILLLLLVAGVTANDQVVLVTELINATPKSIVHLETHFWAGANKTSIPMELVSWQWAPTELVGSLPEGVKWGVAYADDTEPIPRFWVFAFDTRYQKAYAEARPRDGNPINWNQVRDNLDRCENKTSAEDPKLGGKGNGLINGTFSSGIFFEEEGIPSISLL